MKRACLVILVLFAAATVASCGRKAVPRLPAGVQDDYPRGYPQGAPATPDPILTNPKPDVV